jgi:hypothetical protein
MSAKHTQGEWNAKEGQIYSLKTGKTHAVIPYFDQENEEQKANQYLIAASPSILKAYKTLFAAVENGTLEDNFFALREQFKTVIAKAEGE